MASTPTFQEIASDGIIALSQETRERLGVGDGGEVALIDTGDSVVITTRRALVARALDRMGASLPDDLSLEDLIESGRELREGLIYEHYGIRPGDVDQ